MFRTTECPQLFECEVASCRKCRLKGLKRPFWNLPRLICKNDGAFRKAGVLACRAFTGRRGATGVSRVPGQIKTTITRRRTMGQDCPKCKETPLALSQCQLLIYFDATYLQKCSIANT